MILLVCWLGLAMAQDELLAPSIEDVDRSLARVAILLDQADEQGTVLADAQVAWVMEGCVNGRCPTEVATGLAVRAIAAGHDGRSFLQGARAELSRLHRMVGFDAVRPLVDAARDRKLRALAAREDAASRTWLVRAAWHTRYVAPWAAAHPSQVAQACVPSPSTQGVP